MSHPPPFSDRRNEELYGREFGATKPLVYVANLTEHTRDAWPRVQGQMRAFVLQQREILQQSLLQVHYSRVDLDDAQVSYEYVHGQEVVRVHLVGKGLKGGRIWITSFEWPRVQLFAEAIMTVWADYKANHGDGEITMNGVSLLSTSRSGTFVGTRISRMHFFGKRTLSFVDPDVDVGGVLPGRMTASQVAEFEALTGADPWSQDAFPLIKNYAQDDDPSNYEFTTSDSPRGIVGTMDVQEHPPFVMFDGTLEDQGLLRWVGSRDLNGAREDLPLDAGPSEDYIEALLNATLDQAEMPYGDALEFRSQWSGVPRMIYQGSPVIPGIRSEGAFGMLLGLQMEYRRVQLLPSSEMSESGEPHGWTVPGTPGAGEIYTNPQTGTFSMMNGISSQGDDEGVVESTLVLRSHDD